MASLSLLGVGKIASYVHIEFDRTRPIVEIFAPRFTTTEIVNVITVEANEPLSTFQEVYVVDSKGEHHYYVFHQESPSTYVGRIRFNTMPLGIVNIYARFRDEVDNVSNWMVASIEIREHIHFLQMNMRHRARTIDEGHRLNFAVTEREKIQAIKPNEETRKNSVSTKVRKIETTEYDAKAKGWIE